MQTSGEFHSQGQRVAAARLGCTGQLDSWRERGLRAFTASLDQSPLTPSHLLNGRRALVQSMPLRYQRRWVAETSR